MLAYLQRAKEHSKFYALNNQQYFIILLYNFVVKRLYKQTYL